MEPMSRRAFLGGTLLSSLGCRALHEPPSSPAAPQEDPVPGPRLDIHTHLFGVGDGGSGCRMSETVTSGFLFQFLTELLGVKKPGTTFDEGYVDTLVGQVRESGLDGVVLLAQDGVYDSDGRLDEERTNVYVPNEYLFKIVSRHEDRLIPCVSINPDRRDCLDELERCRDGGARILKIHPPIQGVDVADRKHARFFARCAELRMIVMVHTGHEHAAPIIDVALADPLRLELALEEGCTVVACHCGTGWAGEKPDFFPRFLEMMDRHERLWGDTAVLGSPKRIGDVMRLLGEEAIQSRILHGSDFPFPSAPAGFASLLGLERALSLQAETNLLKRDLALKRAVGFDARSAERVHELITSQV